MIKIIIAVAVAFIAGYITCYKFMTHGVDQDGQWVKNSEFDVD